jgi:ABC-2 type transport system permease protein
MNWLGVYTLYRKEVKRFTQIWTQTLIAPVISSVLYLAVFGTVIGARAAGIGDFSYLQLLIPGLVAMGLLMNAYQAPIGSLIIAKYTNEIVPLLMIPLTGFEIALSYIGAAMTRGLIVGAITLAVGAAFVPLPFAHPLLLILFSFLLTGIFSSLGVIIGITMPDFDRASMLQTFVITPLLYLGGVFYSVQSLPSVFSMASRLNPLFYLVDGIRMSILGVGDTPLALSLGVVVVCFALCFGVASWMFQTGYKLKS